jgi:hypothetical protein
MVEENESKKEQTETELRADIAELEKQLLGCGKFPQRLTVVFASGGYLTIQVCGIGQARNYITHTTIPAIQAFQKTHEGHGDITAHYSKGMGGVYITATFYYQKAAAEAAPSTEEKIADEVEKAQHAAEDYISEVA